MGKLSIEEKAKAYDEALKRAIKHRNNDGLTLEQYETIDIIFPELKESEDERIRKEMIFYFQEEIPLCSIQEHADKMKQFLAWLEKQGEKIEPIEGLNTEFERQISHLIASTINKEHEYTKDFVKWTSGALLNYAKHELEKQGEKKSIDDLTQQEAMGVAVANCFEQGENKDKKEHNVCDFCEERYGCVNPCPMKLIEKQKPTDKAEHKFKVGDWIIHKDNKHIPIKIIEKIGMYYGAVDTVNYYHNIYIDYTNENYRLWTIQDAKDGDVLAVGNYQYPFVAIYKERGLDFFNSYCFIGFDGEFYKAETGHSIENIHPATREQRDLLFQKIKEAGYKWDADKKELKKIEEKNLTDFENAMMHIGESFFGRHAGLDPNDTNTIKEQANLLLELVPSKEWNEEDDYNLQCMIAKVTSDIQKGNVGRNNELIDWLKYLKYRVQHQNRMSY